jgi:Ala-tRNA(Pro) deacylase
MKRRLPAIGFRKIQKDHIIEEDLHTVPMLKELRAYLHEKKVKYKVVTHSPAYTSQELAERQHVPGKQLAKVVMVKADGESIMAVLPASHRIDLARLQAVIEKPVELEKVDEFVPLFPGCDTGAEPPFGNLFGIEVWVDSSLAENQEIVFNAGSFREAVHMRYDDYIRLVQPRVATFARHL